jgi:hypothetical protein
MTTLELINNYINNHGIKKTSKELNMSIGTIKRWIEKSNIPHSYDFDIMKLCNIHIDYSKYNFKEKDQFFTSSKSALHCFTIFKEKMVDFGIDETQFYYIEPSAGTGVFGDILPKDRLIMLDIEPRNENIIKCDFLQWFPKDKSKRYISFGNPPFGLRGHLALQFINHSFEFSDFVCFILPPLFNSDGILLRAYSLDSLNWGRNILYVSAPFNSIKELKASHNFFCCSGDKFLLKSILAKALSDFIYFLSLSV